MNRARNGIEDGLERKPPAPTFIIEESYLEASAAGFGMAASMARAKMGRFLL
jgi:hypothetical protein